ncbi:MAG TPA: TIGR03435 family protein [Bryobacteraceae bacterium]|nr:TIGR03435 family protein [Bryobacteraceae bacterium]
MKRILLWFAPLALLAAPASFEVISVKQNHSDDMRGARIQFLPGRFLATNYPLQLMIAAAWNLPFQSTRLSGGPDWIRSERFDIEATTPGGVRIPTAQMRQMLQQLLKDRFHLVMSSSMKELPVFFVTVAKGGPKLEKSAIDEKDCDTAPCHAFTGGQGRGLHAQAVDMGDLAKYVENWAERPVLDKTGLHGLYRIETRPWLPMTPGPEPAVGAKAEDGSAITDLPTLFGIFEGMGLKLEAGKAPIEVFHIDGIQRPSEN